MLAACATTLDKARDHVALGEYDEARILYEEAIAERESEDVAREELAQMYVDRGASAEASDPAKAEREYRLALAVDSVYADALTALVRLLRAQGRTADARGAIDEARKSNACPTCNRLELVMLLEEAESAAKAGRWGEALTGYQLAQEIRPQASVSVFIVRAQFEIKAYPQAVIALQSAVPLMTDADAGTLQNFISLRLSLFNHALETGSVAMGDQVRAVVYANEPSSAAVGMELRIADYVRDNVDPELALARYERMLKRKGEEALDKEQTTEVKGRVARVYANRGTALLNQGKSNNADWAFKKAIEIRPDDWPLRLQRIVAISETVGAVKALQSLEGVPKATYGLETTRGILSALRVRELVEMGELDAARAALEPLQSEHGNVPESHLVAAMVLAKSPVEDLSRKERKAALSAKSIVDYPGEVYRYAEALAEVGWVKTAMAAERKDKLFVAPWLGVELARLDRELNAAYPHAVEFRADPEPVVVLHNTSNGYLDIVVRGPDGMLEELGIPSGDRTEFTVPTSGLLTITMDRSKQFFVAEPYSRVTLRL